MTKSLEDIWIAAIRPLAFFTASNDSGHRMLIGKTLATEIIRQTNVMVMGLRTSSAIKIVVAARKTTNKYTLETKQFLWPNLRSLHSSN